MTTVWITGATGFTGVFLNDFLQSVSQKLQVVGLARSRSGSVKTDLFYEADLTKSDVVKPIAHEVPPSLVFHLAGLAPPHKEAHMWHLNVGGTVNLLHGLAEAGCAGCKVICAGSAAEYRVGSGGLMCENSPVGGTASYGFSKWTQTCAALSLGKELGLKVTVARPFNLVGPNLPERLVAGSICSQFVNPACQDVRVGNVKSERDFIDIRDTVEAYWKIAEYGREGEVYNVCSGKPTSIEKLLSLFSDLSQSDKRIVSESDRMKRIDLDCVYGSNKKLHEASGWKPRISLEQSLLDMLEAARK